MSRVRPRVLLAAAGLILAGTLLDGPTVRRGTLRTVSRVCGRAAEALRSCSISAGLAYLALEFPEDSPPAAPTR